MSKYWRNQINGGGFPSCFWCKCPALAENLVDVKFAAEQEQIPEDAKKVLPPNTLYFVIKKVCVTCGSRINEIVKKWEGVKN